MAFEIVRKMIPLAQKGYCCSQILFLLAFESKGQTNSDLIRSMAGLCNGLGYSGETCGVLTGAACLIAFFAGKGSDEEDENDKFMLMVSNLVEWFRDNIGIKYGGIQCEDILGEDGMEKPDLKICANIVAKTYGTVTKILEENGYKV